MPGSYDIGPKIGMDGEAEFRKSLQNINQQLKTLGTEMKAVTSAFDANDKSQENLANQSQVLTEQLSLQEKRIAEIQKALDHARSNYAENSNQVQRWQQAMNNAVTELNKTRSQLSKVQSEMDGASDSTQDMTEALDDVGGASEKASGGLSSMTVAMGNLISSGIQAAASAVADLVSSLWNLDESTEEYRRAQGRLNTAFEAAGYGTDTAQQAYKAFYGILGDTDTATEASQLLAQLAESEEDVATWTEIAAGVSGTFGDSLPIEGLIEAANETAKVGEVTGTLADALNWVGISEDEFNAKLAAAGSESERNQLIMNTLAGQYDEASEAFYRNNEALVASRNAQAQMDEVTAELGNTIANLKNQLMADFFPAISSLADAFNGILTGAPGATEAFSQAIQDLIAAVVDMLPQFLDTGLQIISSVVNGIVQALPELAQAGVEIIGQIFATITENLPQVLDMGLQLLDQLTSGIESGLPDMVSRIPQIITEFLDYLTGELPTILDKGVEILNNLVDGIIESIPDMVAALPEIITAFTQFVATNLPKIIAAGVDIIGGLIKGLISAIPEIVAMLPQIIQAIVDGIGALMESIVEVGKSIVKGIWQGIQDMASWITEKVTGFFTGIVDGVKDLLGIHSPSKVFAEMGGNMALGLGEGFSAKMPAIQREIDRSIQGITNRQFTFPEVDGFTQRLRAVAGNMTAAIPNAADQFGSIAAGMVNGVQTAVAGGGNYRVEIPIIINGREFSRAILPDLRAVEKSNPEVVSGV